MQFSAPYFMVTTVLRADEDQLTPTLQTQRESASGAQNDFQPQLIDVAVVDGAPAYRLGPRVMRDRADLAAALRPLPKSIGVFVKVSGGVPVGFAVTAIQEARDAGFEQVTYVPMAGGGS
jgi:hypothetical protein